MTFRALRPDSVCSHKNNLRLDKIFVTDGALDVRPLAFADISLSQNTR